MVCTSYLCLVPVRQNCLSECEPYLARNKKARALCANITADRVQRGTQLKTKSRLTKVKAVQRTRVQKVDLYIKRASGEGGSK